MNRMEHIAIELQTRLKAQFKKWCNNTHTESQKAKIIASIIERI